MKKRALFIPSSGTSEQPENNTEPGAPPLLRGGISLGGARRKERADSVFCAADRVVGGAAERKMRGDRAGQPAARATRGRLHAGRGESAAPGRIAQHVDRLGV